VGTYKRIHLPDTVLLRRLAFVVVVTVGVLGIWTGTSMPKVQSLKTSENLKFYVCKYGSWEYGLLGGKWVLDNKSILATGLKLLIF